MLLLYLLFVVLNCIILTVSGLTGFTWQYWVSLFCMIGAYNAGRNAD